MSNSQENKQEGQGHKKEVTIIVNARKKVVPKDDITFAEIVNLAFGNPLTGQNIVTTVTYRRGEDNKSGTLIEGQTVKAKDGMIFDVTQTDKS